jgi:hypothetical protein
VIPFHIDLKMFLWRIMTFNLPLTKMIMTANVGKKGQEKLALSLCKYLIVRIDLGLQNLIEYRSQV